MRVKQVLSRLSDNPTLSIGTLFEDFPHPMRFDSVVGAHPTKALNFVAGKFFGPLQEASPSLTVGHFERSLVPQNLSGRLLPEIESARLLPG